MSEEISEYLRKIIRAQLIIKFQDKVVKSAVFSSLVPVRNL